MNGNVPNLPNIRLGYVIAAVCMFSFLTGLMSGRGKGRDFTVKHDSMRRDNGVQVIAPHEQQRVNNDAILNIYHGQGRAVGGGQQMAQGSNVLSSTYL